MIILMSMHRDVFAPHTNITTFEMGRLFTTLIVIDYDTQLRAPSVAIRLNGGSYNHVGCVAGDIHLYHIANSQSRLPAFDHILDIHRRHTTVHMCLAPSVLDSTDEDQLHSYRCKVLSAPMHLTVQGNSQYSSILEASRFPNEVALVDDYNDHRRGYVPGAV